MCMIFSFIWFCECYFCGVILLLDKESWEISIAGFWFFWGSAAAVSEIKSCFAAVDEAQQQATITV